MKTLAALLATVGSILLAIGFIALMTRILQKFGLASKDTEPWL